MKIIGLLFFSAVISLTFSGCSPSKYEGRTAQEWKEQSDSYKSLLLEAQNDITEILAEVENCEYFDNQTKETVLKNALETGAGVQDLQEVEKLYELICGTK